VNEALIPIIDFVGFALQILTNLISGHQRLTFLSRHRRNARPALGQKRIRSLGERNETKACVQAITTIYNQ